MKRNIVNIRECKYESGILWKINKKFRKQKKSGKFVSECVAKIKSVKYMNVYNKLYGAYMDALVSEWFWLKIMDI